MLAISNNVTKSLIVIGWLATLTIQHALADNTLYSEKGKLIRANEAVTTLGADLMGDQVNLYHGALEFLQTDVSLPGNNALPVGISRRFTANQEGYSDSQFVDWDLELPHISGVFSNAQGFVGENGYSRCTNYGVPPNAVAAQGGGAYFSASEYWHGNFLHTPGGGQQEILKRNATNTFKPTDNLEYKLVTKDWWSIRCIPLKGATDAANEGFLAIAPDGTQYRFDVLVERPYPLLIKSSPSTAPNNQTSTSGNGTVTPNLIAGFSLTRKEVRILPSLITDRYNNTVLYSYDPLDQWKITSIQASDGRSLTLTYETGSHRISTVTDGTRTWNYTYTDLTSAQKVLSAVTLPDASQWKFDLNGLRVSVLDYTGTAETCGQENKVNGGSYSGSITHPSGAVGNFVVSSVLHGRSLVTKNCVTDIYNGSNYSYYALSFGRFSLTSKMITGPGLPTMTWTYAWGPTNSGFDPCASANCLVTKTVLVTDPKGDVTRYTYGNQFRVSEGQLQQIDVGWNATAQTALRTTTMRNRLPLASAGANPYPQAAGDSQQTRGDGEMASQFTPEDQRIITQQGAGFKWEVAAGAAGYDFQARPISVTRSSPYGSRTEATTFFDLPSNWVLGQVAGVREVGTNKMIAENTFNATTGNLETKKEFARLVETIAYNTDGTIYTRADGLGQTSTYSNYKRGLAQNVTYADGKTESAIVNDIGLINSVTNAASQTTEYSYDTIGRLSSIKWPAFDTTAWNLTTLSFVPAAAEYGVSGGHWKQTTITGNAVTINYFDGLWRPVFTRTYDSAAEATTRRVTLRKFDFKGRSLFESFPKRDIADVNAVVDGINKTYDALGRMVTSQTNSELGVLTSTNTYLTSFQKQTTDPRGNTTTASYQAFDEPSEDRPTQIVAPEGVTVNFARDVFGKATSISRSGVYNGGTVSAVRSYVYDGYERLCKTIEPETGATIMSYDAANNVSWRATGVALNSTSICDQASVPAARKVSFTYDTRNRLTNSTYADGSPAIARTYTADGLPETITSGPSAWTYSYNKRRLLTTESLKVTTP